MRKLTIREKIKAFFDCHPKCKKALKAIDTVLLVFMLVLSAFFIYIIVATFAQGCDSATVQADTAETTSEAENSESTQVVNEYQLIYDYDELVQSGGVPLFFVDGVDYTVKLTISNDDRVKLETFEVRYFFKNRMEIWTDYGLCGIVLLTDFTFNPPPYIAYCYDGCCTFVYDFKDYYGVTESLIIQDFTASHIVYENEEIVDFIQSDIGYVHIYVVETKDSGTSYAEGYRDGYEDGSDELSYDTGYSAGYSDGVEQGIESGKEMGYNSGYSKGEKDGYSTGYDTGYSEGEEHGEIIGYNRGYDVGITQTIGYDGFLNTVDNFLSFEFFGVFSIGTLLSLFLGGWLLLMFLKFFA